jgi:CRISPR/Cas system-associated endonuclease Cas1
METLYITQDRCKANREGEHLKLVRSGETLATVPLVGVKTIVVFDNVSISAPAMDLLFYNGIDVVHQSKRGKVKGRTLSVKGCGAMARSS